MSKASENTVSLNAIQIALGIVGAVLVLLSLYYTRVATRAAVVSAKVANDAVTVQRDIGQAQVASYLHVLNEGELLITAPVHTTFAAVVVKNTGQSPAHNIQIKATFTAEDHTILDLEKNFTSHPSISMNDVIPAGEERSISLFWDSLSAAIPILRKDHHAVYLSGTLALEDVFEIERKIRFQLDGILNDANPLHIKFVRARHWYGDGAHKIKNNKHQQ
jgi:hypothetical protein